MGAVDGLANLTEMTMVVVVEHTAIGIDQSNVSKLSFVVVSFHDHQLPTLRTHDIDQPRIGQRLMSHLHF